MLEAEEEGEEPGEEDPPPHLQQPENVYSETST